MRIISDRSNSEDSLSAVAFQSDTQSYLMPSWRRSSGYYKLDAEDPRLPMRVTSAELEMARQSSQPLLHIAKPSMDRLYRATGNAGCCVLLSNADGLIIDRRGNLADDQHFEKIGLWTGSIWSEKLEGTNGIGTCLAEQRPVSIHRDQHYCLRNMSLSCTTAPIFDQAGKLLATLDVSSLRADLDESYLALLSMCVSDAARRIETEYFRTSFPNSRIVMPPIAHCPSNALLAIDAEDLVIGATRAACVILDVPRSIFRKSVILSMIIGEADCAPSELALAERGAIHRALARSSGNVSAAAESLGISRATLHRKLKKIRE